MLISVEFGLTSGLDIRCPTYGRGCKVNCFIFLRRRVLGIVACLSYVTMSYAWSSDCPIIFVHGHESEPKASKGHKTWHAVDYQSGMEKILSEQYQGYTAGSPLNCRSSFIFSGKILLPMAPISINSLFHITYPTTLAKPI